MNNHLTSLELSKKLKELGVKQDSEFYWIDGELLTQKEIVLIQLRIKAYPKANKIYIYSAFLSSELGDELPEFLPGPNGDWGGWSLVISKHSDMNGYTEWSIGYQKGAAQLKLEKIADTEADARAEMLVYLIENNLKTQ